MSTTTLIFLINSECQRTLRHFSLPAYGNVCGHTPYYGGKP